jgi:transcriptional regulator with XRE-family HTH domain
MRLTNVRNLGLYARDRRLALGMTQAEVASAARVSRRWLAELEGGKTTAEVGLVFRLLHALHLAVEVRPEAADPHAAALDEVIRRHTGPPPGASGDG